MPSSLAKRLKGKLTLERFVILLAEGDEEKPRQFIQENFADIMKEAAKLPKEAIDSAEDVIFIASPGPKDAEELIGGAGLIRVYNPKNQPSSSKHFWTVDYENMLTGQTGTEAPYILPWCDSYRRLMTLDEFKELKEKTENREKLSDLMHEAINFLESRGWAGGKITELSVSRSMTEPAEFIFAFKQNGRFKEIAVGVNEESYDNPLDLFA